MTTYTDRQKACIEKFDRPATQHAVKCWPEQFAALRAGIKRFEYRLNDRDYRAGDTLLVCEFNPDTQRFSGQSETFYVTYVLEAGFGLPNGYCVLSLESTSPITGFSEPDGGADVRGEPLTFEQWADDYGFYDTVIDVHQYARNCAKDAWNVATRVALYPAKPGDLVQCEHCKGWSVEPAAPSLPAAPAEQTVPWVSRHCQSGNKDVCRAGQRDGVTCPADSCDIDDGQRPNDAPSTAAQGATTDPRADLGNRMKLAREAGLMLRIDGKFGSDHYHSVTGSWPALIRFAAALAAAKPVSVDAGGMTFEEWLKGPHEHNWNDQNHPLTVSEKVAALKGWKAGRASMSEREAVTERPKYSEPRRLNSRGYCVGCRCYGEELDPCAWAHAQSGKQTPPTESTGEPQ